MKTIKALITNLILTCLYLVVTPLNYAQVANVYVPAEAGILAYNASSTGALTPIKGSPFTETSGLAVGTNGTSFITLGTDYVHAYTVSSTGAIGAQTSEINTQLYSGAECGLTNGAVLDHTGLYLYVLLDAAIEDGDTFCSTIQTYEISPKGILTFKGADVLSTFKSEAFLPMVAGNDKFALGFQGVADSCQYQINSYSRASTGLLELGASVEKDPLPPPSWIGYLPIGMTEDPTNHYAVTLVQTGRGPCGTLGSLQLGSYTGTASGLSSTNTWENMPVLTGEINLLRMSPAGNLLAIATGTGVQFFHFNGGAPITKYTNVAPGSINAMQWDGSNHLYALGSGALYVYTATTTSVKEVGATKINAPSNVIVRSR
jgi:hypothetical protein